MRLSHIKVYKRNSVLPKLEEEPAEVNSDEEFKAVPYSNNKDNKQDSHWNENYEDDPT